METFFGVVEDRHDPLKVGRVRVRIHGIHTDNKSEIATPDLPWAHVILPTTAGGLSGIGFNSHGLVEGATVFGFFRDSTKQDPVVLGVSTGITTDGYKQTVDGAILSRKVDKGFNDPRRLKGEDYNNTEDGVAPTSAPTRSWGLTYALDTAPKQPSIEGRDIKYDGSGSTVDHAEIKEDELPYYPLNFEESDISKFARGEGDYSVREINSIKGMEHYPNSPASPLYPYNKVLHTESGHLIEIDDTFEAERLAIEHRSGTFTEIHPDGSEVHHVVNDQYHVVCKDQEVYVGGLVNVRVLGNAKIHANGDVNVSAYGNGKFDVSGELDLKSGKDMRISSARNIVLSAVEVKMNS